MKCSLPLQIGTKITIKDYNKFLHNHGSSGYKFLFELSSDNKTGNVYIISMAKKVHEAIVTQLQDILKVPNGGVIDDPPIDVSGQVCKKIYSTLLYIIEFSIFL